MDHEDAGRPAPGTLDESTARARADTLHAVLDVVRRLRARERGHLAGVLHDGPMQDLAAMALGLGMPRSDAPDGMLQQVDGAGRELRRIQDQLWPFPPPAGGLIETLRQRTAWLLDTPLAVAVGDGAAALQEADVQAAADVAELLLTGLGTAGAWDRPMAVVAASQDLIFLELNVTSAPAGDPAIDGPAAEAWLHRVAAAIQARAGVGLSQRRLRMWLEIPRCPAGSPGAPAGHDQQTS
jgi:hypothetical protein